MLKERRIKFVLKGCSILEIPFSVVNFQGRPKLLAEVLEEQLGPLTFRVRLEDGRLWKRHVDHIRVNIPAEPVVRGSEVSRQPLGTREQTVTRHSTSVAQLPAPYRDSSSSTIGDSLEDEHPRTQMRTRFQKRKEERRNNAETKPKASTSAWNKTQKWNGLVPCP